MSAARTARPRSRRRTRPTTVGYLAVIVFLFLAGIGAILALATVGTYVAMAQGLDDPAKLTDYPLPEETVIYDRTGKIELARFGDAKREVVNFDEIPPVLLDATTAVEDKTFWDNAGLRSRSAIVSAGARLVAWRHPRRVDDHPAAGPGAPARSCPRPGPAPDRRAEAQGDHPVDPGDPALPRARPASSRSSPPTSTRTTTATRATA